MPETRKATLCKKKNIISTDNWLDVNAWALESHAV